MKAFAELLDRLSYSPSRNAKLRLLTHYLQTVPDPDRGWALAALTDGLPFSFPFAEHCPRFMERRSDPELFRLSRDYVGDTAETIALMWDQAASSSSPPVPANASSPYPPAEVGGTTPMRLSNVVSELAVIDLNALGAKLEGWLDGLGTTERWALLKLLTGALRVGVSARLAKTAVAQLGGREVAEIEEVWHALSPPYGNLFDWIEGRGPPPDIGQALVFRPLMLSHALDDDWAELNLAHFWAEWKWDGIRVQLAGGSGETVLFSRSGDDISGSFPDIVQDCRIDAVLDGELLVVRDGIVAPFGDLQQRLNRKGVSKRQLDRFPAHVRLYDILLVEGEDLRALPLSERRNRLEDWHARVHPARTDLSEIIQAHTKEELQRLWAATRDASIEGVMLKRRDSPYLSGRPKGQWYKWKRAPLALDCVLMYAQRGSGKRSSYYSDYTFGAWRAGDDGKSELVPVGKAYFGFTDEELIEIDRWVRNNTVESFGPVRAVAPSLVFEVAFDAAQASSRHKSGVAMRFPRVHRIRWDKPADQADRLETLLAMIAR